VLYPGDAVAHFNKEIPDMKTAVQFGLWLLCLCLLPTMAFAQDQYNEGTVERVVLVRILPGHFNAFMDDLKKNIQPIWDAEKANGWIEGEQIFFNQTRANAQDWDIGFSDKYKNMGTRWAWPEGS
jgi:hypothetical protein